MPPQQGVSVDDELNNTPLPLPAAHPDHGIGNDDDTNNRNVNLILTYTGMAFAGRAVWNKSCLPTLIFLLRDDTKAVGVITGVMGLSQLLASIPTGILADKYRRDTLLKIGAVFGVAAIVAMLCEIVVRPGYPLLVVALVLWGLHWGVVNTAILALFSDSINDGERSFYFTRRAITINVGNMCGPLIALLMFAILGDTWTVKDCLRVMLTGNLLCLPGVILLCFLNDNNNVVNENINDRRTEDVSTECDDSGLEQPLLLPSDEGNATTELQPSGHRRAAVTADTHEDERYDEERLGKIIGCFCCLGNNSRTVAILVATSDIIAGLASGMSIRFIAIFLYDNLKLSPIAVQTIYMLIPGCQIMFRRKAQRLAGIYGRCAVTICMKWIGILLMVCMIVSFQHDMPRSFICILLILRACFMNSPGALTKSLLMDHVPKDERAKWASLESVNMVSWSGSAALGGVLVQKEGILFNFCITALMQFIATGPLLFLNFFRKKEEHDDDDDDEIVADNVDE